MIQRVIPRSKGGGKRGDGSGVVVVSGHGCLQFFCIGHSICGLQ